MTDAYDLDENTRWQNRIVGHDLVEPDQLLANPLNARIHEKFQQDAVAGLLDEVGWVKSVQVNTHTQHIVDGHLRVTLALRKGEKVPVEYVDLTEQEERLALASLDYMVGMAVTDAEILDDLLRDVSTGDEDLQRMLADLAEDAGIVPPDFEPVSIDEQPRLDQKKPVTCPECGHEFQPS